MTWRPLPNRDDDHDGIRPVGDSLAKLSKRLGLGDPGALSAVFRDWEDVVGVSLADHSRPDRLRDGELVVLVDEPAWATEVRFAGDEIRLRCNRRAGSEVVRSVVVRVDTKQSRPRWPQASPEQP